MNLNQAYDTIRQMDLAGSDTASERICVRMKGRILFLTMNEIRWIEAAGNYLKLHGEQTTYTIRDTMSEFEKRLDPQRFLRIHRSVIVNTHYIRELKPWYTGDHILIMQDGKELMITRGYRSAFEQITAAGGCAKRPDGTGKGLALKTQCEKCSKAVPAGGDAFICSYECTFCEGCAESYGKVCPNCQGELVKRPKRKV